MVTKASRSHPLPHPNFPGAFGPTQSEPNKSNFGWQPLVMDRHWILCTSEFPHQPQLDKVH